MLRGPRGTRWSVVLTITLMTSIPLALYLLSGTSETTPGLGIAPDLTATTLDNETISLSNLSGQVIVLHFTNIESPVCIECERELEAQTRELAGLRAMRGNVTIITVNMRRNPYSEDGRALARRWWGIDVTWHWIEDPEPYPVSARFLKYWTVGGATANPTIMLLDGNRSVVGLYHVYQMGKGEVDGIQDADSLLERIERIERGKWSDGEGEIEYRDPTFLGMFILGALTSLAPCSLVMTMTVISYTMTDIEGEHPDGKRSFAGEGLILGITFTAGMSLVFLLMGIFVSMMGEVVRNAPAFYLASGSLLVLFGLNGIVPLRDAASSLFVRPRRGRARRRSAGRAPASRMVAAVRHITERSFIAGGFLLGILFAFAWAPCAISLVLPVVILMLSHETTALTGALLFFSFGLGHGLPVIPLAAVSRSVRGRVGERYVAAGGVITKAFGAFLVVLGILFAARYFGIAYW